MTTVSEPIVSMTQVELGLLRSRLGAGADALVSAGVVRILNTETEVEKNE